MKKLLIVLAVLFMGLSLASCGNKSEDTIAILMSNSSNEFFSVLENSFVEKAEELGYKVEVYDAANVADKQPSQVENAIAKGVKAIVINPLNKDATKSVLNDAIDKGIAVVTVDTTVEGVDLLAAIATDNEDGGKFAAEWLVEKSGLTTTDLTGVIHVKGIDGHTAHISRYKGFNDYLKSSNVSSEWNELVNNSDKYIELTGNFAQDVAQDAFSSKLSALDTEGKYAVYAENDVMAIGVVQAIENDARFDIKNFTIIGFDGSNDGKDLVDEGKMAVTVVQDFDFIGQKAALVLHDYFTNGTTLSDPTVAIEVVMYPEAQNPRS